SRACAAPGPALRGNGRSQGMLPGGGLARQASFVPFPFSLSLRFLKHVSGGYRGSFEVFPAKAGLAVREEAGAGTRACGAPPVPAACTGAGGPGGRGGQGPASPGPAHSPAALAPSSGVPSQTLTVRSAPAEARRCPSGLNATAPTAPVCP